MLLSTANLVFWWLPQHRTSIPPADHLASNRHGTRRMRPTNKLQLILGHGQRHNCLPACLALQVEWLRLLWPQESHTIPPTVVATALREHIIVDVHPKWLNRRLCRNGPCKYKIQCHRQRCNNKSALEGWSLHFFFPLHVLRGKLRSFCGWPAIQG